VEVEVEVEVEADVEVEIGSGTGEGGVRGGTFLGGVGFFRHIVQVAVAALTHISNPPASWITLPEELFRITSNFPTKVVSVEVEVKGL
jgi:hypothetical protein